jgi:hypothetical protein
MGGGALLIDKSPPEMNKIKGRISNLILNYPRT